MSTLNCRNTVLHANDFFFCARCKCYLCVSAVDYMAVVSVSVRWRGSLMASQCDGDSVTAAPPLMASVVLFVFRQQTAHFVSGIVFFFFLLLSYVHVSFCFFLSCNTLPSRRTLKNSRLVCKKDDVHVCIMCLRAIMNYQVRRSHSPLDTHILLNNKM